MQKSQPPQQKPRLAVAADISSSPTARIVGALTFLLGLLVLAAWVLGIASLKSVIPGAVDMKANTALALVMAGGSLWLLARPGPASFQIAAQAIGGCVSLLGVATLGEYVGGQQLGIDQLLFGDTATAFNTAPGRMSSFSASTYSAMGLALVIFPSYRLRPLLMLACALAILVGAASIVGYMWNANEMATDYLVAPVAIHTAVAFILLGWGLMLASRARHLHTKVAAAIHASIELTVSAGFAIALLLLVVGGGIMYRSVANSAQSALRLVHTQEVRARLSNLYGEISDAESSALAYVLTGEVEIKSNYKRLGQCSQYDMQVLRDLVTDNARQAFLLANIQRLVVQRLKSLDQIIKSYDSSASLNPRAGETAQDTLQLMKRVRAAIQEMDGNEAQTLEQLEHRDVSDRYIGLCLLIATLALVAVIFAFQARNIRRKVLARAALDEDLHRINAERQAVLERRTAELKKTNEALEKSTALYLNALDNMLVGCQVIDFDWCYRYINSAARRHYSQSHAPLIGSSMLEAYPIIKATPFFAALSRCMDQRIAHYGENEFVFTDGRHAWAQISMLPTPEGVSIFSMDITRHKQAESEISAANTGLEQRIAERTSELVHAREVADAANRAKSAFLATLSHEIRMPMNGVIGMLEVLLNGRLDGPQNEAAQTIRTSAFSLLQIIDDMLDHSKTGSSAQSEKDFGAVVIAR